MSWSIAVVDADQIKGVPDAVAAIKTEYGRSIEGIVDFHYEFVHDYDMLPQDELEHVMGSELLGCNLLFGLYKDIDVKIFGDGPKEFRLFSISRWAERLVREYPALVKGFKEHGAIVDAIDRHKIKIPEKQLGRARLIGSVLQAAANPLKGYPVLTFFW